MSATMHGNGLEPRKEFASHGFRDILCEVWDACGGPSRAVERVEMVGTGDLPSAFAVSDLAAASVAAAGLAVSELTQRLGAEPLRLRVDRRLASMWFGTSLRPDGWAPPPPWDPIAGDYRGTDGWIRLHTNAPAHRQAALNVLGVGPDKAKVASATALWDTDALETAVVAEGGCAAKMRSLGEWAAHEQGRAVLAEPLIHHEITDERPDPRLPGTTGRPLAGIKVLDLTRVLAGPIATRFLAGYGADVLRIDAPDWDEPGVVPEVMLGKRSARLDLRDSDDRGILIELLAQADILIHGYRPDALDRLGLGSAVRHQIRPGLIDVCLDAYGWSGPWRQRRGFDSLVQMSGGIAEAGMRILGKDRPTPLPVQALDHATGYLMAAAAILGLVTLLETGRGLAARTSLARTAGLLSGHMTGSAIGTLAPESDGDMSKYPEATFWGPARRLNPPPSTLRRSRCFGNDRQPLSVRIDPLGSDRRGHKGRTAAEASSPVIMLRRAHPPRPIPCL